MIRCNIFDLKDVDRDPEKEFFETIFTANNCKLERIVSSGQTTPPGEWYDQEQDEWVILLQGKAILGFDNGKEINLESGDFVFIPAKMRHRVASTSHEPPCVWLAIHGSINLQKTDI